MKYKELLEKILKNKINENGFTKFIKYAYYAGAEKKTKILCDKFSKILIEEKENANKKRYKKLIKSCMYYSNYLYDNDYAQDYQKIFENDIIKYDMILL